MSPQEFVAEVFAEYQSGKSNQFVKDVMKYIYEVYDKKLEENKKII